LENIWSFSVECSSVAQTRVKAGSARPVRIGGFRVEPDLDRVSGPLGDSQLEPKTMAVLMYLAERQGQVVSARELIDAIWLGRPMGDNPVYRCISQLRRAFGDDPLRPEFIATVPTKGYRLVAPVESAEEMRRERLGGLWAPGRSVLPIAGLVASLAGIAALFWAAHRDEPPPSPAENTVVSRSFEAYQHYMIGHEMMVRRPAGFRQEALRQFDRALEIDPGFAEAFAERGIVSLFDGKVDAEDSAVLLFAQRDIQTALALNPDSAMAHAAQGFLLQRRYPPDFAASEEALRRAVALDPSLVNAWNWLSLALNAQGLEQESYLALQSAALIDPLAPSIGANLAGREASRGLFDAAEKRLSMLLAVPQPASMIYIGLFNLYCETGRLADALELARQRALNSVKPGRTVEGLSQIASVFAILGEWERTDYWRAREELESADAIQVRLGRIRVELASAYPGYARSVAAFRETLTAAGFAFTSLDVDRQIEYGALLALAGEYVPAISVLEPLLDPGRISQRFETKLEVDARHALAWAWLQTGETERARVQLTALDRKFRHHHDLGLLHRSTDLFEYARNELLLGKTGHALDLLEQAEQAGWRGYYEVERDPRWNAVREERRFAAVLERVRSHLAVERAAAEVDRTDGDFVTRLDIMLHSNLVQTGRPD
jgi:DNA-binding winged helix-turn-helix (wHTH) protein/tetratricopeptide (TPR) repeat protein